MACRHPLAMTHMACPLCAQQVGGERGEQHALVSMPLLRALILSDWGFSLTASFNLNHLRTGPVSKYHHTGSWSFNVWFWGYRVQFEEGPCGGVPQPRGLQRGCLHMSPDLIHPGICLQDFHSRLRPQTSISPSSVSSLHMSLPLWPQFPL